MLTIEALVRRMGSGAQATRPRLTYYGADERIELSGRVLDNWVAKAANLLTEEFDLEPGMRVLLDLPTGHWRQLYWALATWSCGATVVTPDRAIAAPGSSASTAAATHAAAAQAANPATSHAAADRGLAMDPAIDPAMDLAVDAEMDPEMGPAMDLVITADPGRHGESIPMLVVSLPALARRCDIPLPAGAMDEAATLSGYGDSFEAIAESAPGDTALHGTDGECTFADLTAVAPGGSGQSVRRLSVRPQQPLAFLRLAVATWAGDGSLVVLADERDARELIGPEQVTEVTDGTDEPGGNSGT